MFWFRNRNAKIGYATHANIDIKFSSIRWKLIDSRFQRYANRKRRNHCRVIVVVIVILEPKTNFRIFFGYWRYYLAKPLNYARCSNMCAILPILFYYSKNSILYPKKFPGNSFATTGPVCSYSKCVYKFTF